MDVIRRERSFSFATSLLCLGWNGGVEISRGSGEVKLCDCDGSLLIGVAS